MFRGQSLIISLVAALLLLVSSQAFAPSFSRHRSVSISPLQAADGAPQYDKIDAVLKEAEKVAEGSYMLHVEIVSRNDDDDDEQQLPKLDYQPGHVLALELEDTSGDLNDDDAKKNGGWMRGPYTVSRATERSLDVMIRVVGKKSTAFAEASPGTAVRFGGKFKVPILEGIAADDVQKVMMISTGVGIGPCVGAIEKATTATDPPFPPIALVASFREEDEVAYREHLDEISQQHPTNFEWIPVVTSQSGRISQNQETMKVVTNSIQNYCIGDTHYHLIGNGQMVNEWKAGLEKAGVPEHRITTESYFNHKAESDQTAIETIAAAVAASCTVEA